VSDSASSAAACELTSHSVRLAYPSIWLMYHSDFNP